MAEKMKGAKSEPDLMVIKQDSANSRDENYEENKENFAPCDQFDDNNLKYLIFVYLL